MERPCDVETGEFNKRASLIYHYGHSSPGPNIKLYNTVVSQLASMFKERCKVNPKSEFLFVCVCLWGLVLERERSMMSVLLIVLHTCTYIQ